MKKNINTAYGNIREKIERGIIEKLKYAWESICECLEKRNHDLALRINLPSIVLTDIKTCLGQWNNEYYEIRLSRQLVFNGRWDSVCEVLRHEIAHQLASSFDEYQNQPPHGKLFIQCCKAVNANPAASGSYATLEQRVFGGRENHNDKIMIKVKKLMNLASSGNRHEAEVAAAKAGELIRKYNIELIKHDKKRNFESIIITEPSLKRTQAQLLTASILQSFYFVRPIWLSTYIPEKSKIGTVLEITGTLTNIRIADYVFHYVLKYAERCWKEYKLKNPECRSKSGYMTGIVNGFREKLKEQQKFYSTKTQKSTKTENSRSILHKGNHEPVPVEDKQLTTYFHYRYPSIVTSRARYSSTSRSAYNSGKSKGRNLTISKGISTHYGNLGKRIGLI